MPFMDHSYVQMTGDKLGRNAGSVCHREPATAGAQLLPGRRIEHGGKSGLEGLARKWGRRQRGSGTLGESRPRHLIIHDYVVVHAGQAG